jgi:hypothetical protein
MNSSKTSWLDSKKHRTNYDKKQRFKYLTIKDKIYRLKNALKIQLSRINYDQWKKTYFLKLIDLLWNALIIFLVIITWKQGNAYLKGISITLFFIVFLSYLEDIKNTLKN